jgi:cytochrome c biogenesis protein CcmG/thiol:disulfide interchange protein DsbE
MRRSAFLLLCLALPALCCVSAVRAGAASAPAPVIAGSRAPDFSRAAFDGKPVTLSAYRGKVVLLDFWASWCAPCLEEMPDLIDLQKRSGGKLQVIGVSMDDGLDAAKSVTTRFSFNYPLVMGDAKFGNLYGGVLGLPEIYLIGRDGKVLKRWRGDMKPGELDQAVKAAVG